jgi:zinc and cadmium transporter
MTPFLAALAVNIFIAIILISIIIILKPFRVFLTKHINILTTITVGIIFFLVFLEFIPELIPNLEPFLIGFYILVGLLSFYMIELILHWHHCADLNHKSQCEHNKEQEHKHGNMMFFGTLLHNIFHGIVIFSAFIISFPTGIALSIGIFFHALPQNLANFIMNHKQINSTLIAAGGGIIGVLISLPFLSILNEIKYITLAITTGGLLYISLSDILPSVNQTATYKQKFIHLSYIILGIFLMYILEFLIHI